MVVEQNELQNECRSRETCSFGTPDAVVCKAARSASAVLAAVGRSVGIGARAGAGFGGARAFQAARRRRKMVARPPTAAATQINATFARPRDFCSGAAGACASASAAPYVLLTVCIV